MSDSAVLKPSDFVFSSTSRNVIHFEMTLEEMEKRMIIDSLKKYSNNMSIISGKLGITRQTLYNKMKKYDL
jgi:transcriptional regulator with PAS, ATPase and Fis domain